MKSIKEICTWTLFYYQLMHTTLKNAELLKHSKLDKNAPTCFSLHRNHLQGAKVSAWLKKKYVHVALFTTCLFFSSDLCCSVQPVLPVSTQASHLHQSLLCQPRMKWVLDTVVNISLINKGLLTKPLLMTFWNNSRKLHA